MPPKKKIVDPFTPTYTLTFCECGENHVGNQQVGKIADRGFDKVDLRQMLRNMQILYRKMRDNAGEGIPFCIIDLATGTIAKYSGEDGDADVDADIDDLDEDHPWVLYVPNFVSKMGMNYADVVSMLDDLEFDTKAKMYGRVVNKKARHNLIFGPEAQEPDYAKGKGTILAFEDLPEAEQLCYLLLQMRDGADNAGDEIAGDDSESIEPSDTSSFSDYPLYAELNKYYAPKTGIGYHGDTERRTVMGIRIGPAIPLVFKWYKKHTTIPDTPIVRLEAGYGDLYVMSDKAVGHNWKSSSIATLRHAAGSRDYIGEIDLEDPMLVVVNRDVVAEQ